MALILRGSSYVQGGHTQGMGIQPAAITAITGLSGDQVPPAETLRVYIRHLPLTTFTSQITMSTTETFHLPKLFFHFLRL